METTSQRGVRKSRRGTVTSDAMDKTIVVRVERRVRHPVYGKELKMGKRYHAHDEKNEAKVGDQVEICETRPLSRTKRWRLVRVLKTGGSDMTKGEHDSDEQQS